MNWRDAISEGFPSPHGREPASLRNDIADELADHLACSLNRELLRTPDETAARRAVLDRFGDPKQIARRLLWDAMKEIIMKDRVFTMVLMAGMLALVAAFVVPWAAQQNRVNEAILQQLQTLGSGNSQPAVLENWTHVTVRVLEETKAGPPVAGVNVMLVGNAFQDKAENLSESTDTNGEASFGPIRPGSYQLKVSDPEISILTEMHPQLYAGQRREFVFVAPSRRSAPDFSIWLQVPEELRDSPCYVGLQWEAEPITRGDTKWDVILPSPLFLELTGKIRSGAYRQVSAAARTCLQLEPEQISIRKWPSTQYRIKIIEFYCPIADPGFGYSFCTQKIAGKIFDKPIEFQSGTPKIELEIPNEFLAAYAETLRKPVPVSYELKSELLKMPEPKDFFEKPLLALHFVPEPGSPALDPYTGEALEHTVFIKVNGGMMGGISAKLDGEMMVATLTGTPGEGQRRFTFTGRYLLKQIIVLNHVPMPNNTWRECARFDQRTAGWNAGAFETKPNRAATWTVQVPGGIVKNLEQCAVVGARSTIEWAQEQNNLMRQQQGEDNPSVRSAQVRLERMEESLRAYEGLVGTFQPAATQPE